MYEFILTTIFTGLFITFPVIWFLCKCGNLVWCSSLDISSLLNEIQKIEPTFKNKRTIINALYTYLWIMKNPDNLQNVGKESIGETQIRLWQEQKRETEQKRKQCYEQEVATLKWKYGIKD